MLVDSRRWTKLLLAVAVLIAIAFVPTRALALKVGDKVWKLKVKDASDHPTWMPDIGKKLLVIFYTDPDVKDMNEPFRDRLKAAKLDESKYRGYGVVNLKDTWKPNFIIRKMIRNKIKKFKSTILTDPSLEVCRKWRLGDCNEKDIVIIVGVDKKVKYIKLTKMSVAEQKRTVKLVADLIARGGK